MMRKIGFIAVTFLTLLASSGFAADVAKVKGSAALLDLKGEPAAPGDLFYAKSADGKRRGIIQITKVKGDKAIGKKQYFRRKKLCRFCVDKIDDINYKDTKLLNSFISERGKVTPRRISGVCAPHQRRLAEAIKQARSIALLPFSAPV